MRLQAKKGHHIHGGVPELEFERLGIAKCKVADFSVNISPLGVPSIVFENWNRLLAEVSQYPSLSGEGIKDYYENWFGLSRDTILPGNGSTECLYLVPRALGLKNITIVMPSFHDYERSCRQAGIEILQLPLSQENSFQQPGYEKLKEMLEKTEALMLGNPNNPTGTTFSPDKLLRLADLFPEKWILVDEAFIQFLQNYQEMTLIRKDRLRPNLLVFHSLTKFYALPGIRLGCVIGHAQTIKKLQKFKEPWSVNAIAEKIASLLISCGDYENQLRQLIKRERSRIYRKLAETAGIRLYDSSANFVLAQWTATKDLDDLLRTSLANGLHLRDCRNFAYLEKNFFRFAIRKKEDNIKLISVLNQSGD